MVAIATPLLRGAEKAKTAEWRYALCSRDEARIGNKFWVRTAIGTIEQWNPLRDKLPRGCCYVRPEVD